MKKVVIFNQKSTIQQEYDHQENLLIDVCKKNDWEIVSTIRETISGTKRNEDRIGIGQLKNVVLELKPDIVEEENNNNNFHHQLKLLMSKEKSSESLTYLYNKL